MLIDVLRHEWRLLKRSRLAWLLSILYIALVIGAATDMLKLGVALFFDNYHRLSAFVTLPLLLFGAHLARRDEVDRFAEIQAVQPVGNSVLIGGRLLVGAGAAVAAAVVQALTATIYTLWRGAPLHLFARALVDVGAVTLLNLLCAVAIGFMVGVVVGRRAGLAVTAACWLSQFAVGIVSTAPGWQWFRIFDLSGAWGLTPTDLWGLGPDRALQALKGGFVLTVSIAATLCAVLASERRRPAGLSRGWLRGLAALVAVAIIITPAAYFRAYDARAAAAEHEATIELAATVTASFRITSYDLTANLADQRLAVEGELTIVNDSPGELADLPLTLRDTLNLTDATWAGLPVTSERHDHWLVLHLPQPLAAGGTGRLHLTYSGELAGWQVHGNNFQVTTFRYGVGADFAYLPYAVAWYPVAGHRETAPVGHPRNGMAPHAPADFHLSVGDKQMALQSNLASAADGSFVGQGYTGVYLLGAPELVVGEANGVRLTHDTAAARDPATVALLGDAVRLAGSYLPTRAVAAVDALVLPTPLVSDLFPPAPSGPDGRLVLALNERLMNVSTVHRRELVSYPIMAQVISQSLAPGRGIDTPEAVVGIALWLEARVGDQLGVRDYPEQTRVLEPAAQSGQIDARIYLALARIDRLGGASAVRKALAPLAANPELSGAELAAHLELVSAGGGQ